MQALVVLIAPPMALARPSAAIAMTEPITARIKAYSAADAPLSSRMNDFTNLIIITPLV